MNALYDMVKEAQHNAQYEVNVVRTFEPKIKKSLRLTQLENRDDLEQELKIKLIGYVRDYSLQDVPGLFDLIKENERKRITG
ncbi:hypothetical protein LCM10_08540 [Rossellomorea aquimaris]|uniref:hypothetical protein n=1 Tax=Rossellomorea aquimaris TaxID=189382 RepID=UPI001CD61BEC|nr:hypothetical protein [Rossellomorea aquimaris]MCA1055031.1 hypothetical protein [Rossellomorea aquimaris]